jgi:hypothetical protein
MSRLDFFIKKVTTKGVRHDKTPNEARVSSRLNFFIEKLQLMGPGITRLRTKQESITQPWCIFHIGKIRFPLLYKIL